VGVDGTASAPNSAGDVSDEDHSSVVFLITVHFELALRRLNLLFQPVLARLPVVTRVRKLIIESRRFQSRVNSVLLHLMTCY
jgi:hypothetical protein